MKVIVGVADMKVSARPEDVLVTHGLGSCLGIAVYDRTARVGGMLHVMMPVSAANPEKARNNPYMFVDTGVPAFFQSLEATGAVRRRCTLKVAGGALVNGNDYFETGRKNYIILKKIFWKSGVLIDAEDVGGNVARTMYMDIGTGRVWLNKAGREQEL